MKLTDLLKEAGIEMGKVYTDKDKPPFKITEKKKDDKIQDRFRSYFKGRKGKRRN